MASSAAPIHQLGRRVWASVRDSLGARAGRGPVAAARRHGAQRSLARWGLAHSVFAAAAEASGRGRGAFRRPFSFLSGGGSGRPLGGFRSMPTNNNVRRSCTSGGLLLLGLSSPSTSSSTVVATCTAAADTAALAGTSTAKTTTMGRMARQAWQQKQQRPRSYGQQQQKQQQQQQQPHTLRLERPQPGGLVVGLGLAQRSRLWLGQQRTDGRRCKSTSSGGGQGVGRDSSKHADRAPASSQPARSRPHETDAGATGQRPPPEPQPPEGDDAESIASSMSKYLQSHLPKIPHRPTKEELLAAATGFGQRLKVRLKWFSIRSMRPWNADEWGAFVSWFMLGHLVWILVGTTTFVSLLILTINTVVAQETLAKWVGDYLTQSAGVTVVFESAIVPKWRNGVITFHNVFVSRRPGQSKSYVIKGSSSSAAAVAAARLAQDAASSGSSSGSSSGGSGGDGGEIVSEEVVVDDGNYTQFDVTINSVDVTLSFYKWWNGKGMLKDVAVRGVRGVIDRTSVRWSDGPLDPFSFRHEHLPGDFEIERFKLEDLLVTVHQPGGFRPFSASIFSCELPQLRKQWLFYDFLSANHVSGSFDGSLFTIHPRQVQVPHSALVIPGVVDTSHHNINNPTALDPIMAGAADAPESALAWKKLSRLRIDGLKIDHLNRGDPGPFGWIYEGNVDIVADVMLPAEADESLAKVMSDFYDKMEEAVTSNRYIRILDGNYGSRAGRDEDEDGGGAELDTDGFAAQGHLGWSEPAPPAVPPASAPASTTTAAAITTTPPAAAAPPQYVIMDLRLHLNDVRAAVPFFPAAEALGATRAQAYVNAALIRPIVAYMNAKRTYIPISCRVVKHLSDFDGSWTAYDCGLLDDTSAEVYAAFARDVVDQQSRVRRLKKVGFWTLSMVVHALLAGVAGDLL